jgi:hypothetical protein
MLFRDQSDGPVSVSHAVFHGFGDHRVAGVRFRHLSAVQASIPVPAREKTESSERIERDVFVEAAFRDNLATDLDEGRKDREDFRDRMSGGRMQSNAWDDWECVMGIWGKVKL